MKKKDTKNCDCGNEILRNKNWINNIKTEKEDKWLANSRATTNVPNTEKYMFIKIKNKTAIMIGTSKETKAIARGDVIIHHSIINQLINLKDMLLVPELQQNIMSLSENIYF